MGNIEAMCPFCKEVGRIYGLPFNLTIGTLDEEECEGKIDKIILINCDNCGAILGAYKSEGEH